MIKLEKDLTAIPQSLIPAFADLFPGHASVPRPARTTHGRRMELIRAAAYIDEDVFNSRYKLGDVRTSLVGIYKNKCAFCETKIEQFHVEHYRPKQIYYWLAYSWDNLILACATCNEHKGMDFAVLGPRVLFANTPDNVRNINGSSAGYDALELPEMVNPEVTDPDGHIVFERDGRVRSDHSRVDYTIRQCKIDRKMLNDNRRKLLGTFRDHIRAALVKNDNPHDQLIAIKTIIDNFIQDSKDPELEYLAFRRYAIGHSWLNEIIKEVKGG